MTWNVNRLKWKSRLKLGPIIVSVTNGHICSHFKSSPDHSGQSHNYKRIVLELQGEANNDVPAAMSWSLSCPQSQSPWRRKQWLVGICICSNSRFGRQDHRTHKRWGRLQSQVLWSTPWRNINLVRTLISIRFILLGKGWLSYLFLGLIVLSSGTPFSGLALRTSPNFSVTTHSFTLPISIKPVSVAFIRCIDITFSKRIQNGIIWSDLRYKQNKSDGHETEQGHLRTDTVVALVPRIANGVEDWNGCRDVHDAP